MAKKTSTVKQDRAYNSADDTFSQYVVNPEWSRQTGTTLLDLTNISTNTTDYGYFDMEGYRYFVLQAETSGTAPTDVLTCTIEALVQDDGTAPTSATSWEDVTELLTGQTSFVDEDFLIVCSVPMPFRYFRLKYVTSNDAGDDCDLTVYLRQSW